MTFPIRPVIGISTVTHHNAELTWQESLKAAETISKRLVIILQVKDKNSGTWSTVYKGYGMTYLATDLEPWSSYTYRLMIQAGNKKSEWSPEFMVTTLKQPFTGENIHRAIIKQDATELHNILTDSRFHGVVDAQDKYGFSGLMQCAQKGYTDLMEILIEAGADVNLHNDSGKTALMLAAYAGKLAAMKELKRSGAKFNAQDLGGSTALHWAVDSQNLEVIEWLMDNGSSLSIKDHNGWTPFLRIGAMNGNAAVAKLFIKRGVNINEKDKDGKTALMMATVNGHLDLVKLLLENKCDVTIKNQFGKTAYDMACSMDKKRISKIIEAHGNPPA